MKKTVLIFVIFFASYFNGKACAYFDETMLFYNLFFQTNIADKDYYMFLRDDDNKFYSYMPDEGKIHFEYRGNLKLWHQLLKKWSKSDIEKAVYDADKFDWSEKQSSLDKSVKKYLDFANKCSDFFSYRVKTYGWEAYDEDNSEPSYEEIEQIEKEAKALLEDEDIKQLKYRYLYQLIKILNYSDKYKEAISVFNEQIKDKMPENEMYYYILDQIGGSYYNIEDYNKAAYIFANVISNSIDRKKSAYLSYNLCIDYGYDGSSLISGVEDKKDLLFLKALNTFSSNRDAFDKLIHLQANDPRIELLFMRDLNDLERILWTKTYGFYIKNYPEEEETPDIIYRLIRISKSQIDDSSVKNKDFWKLALSYLYFMLNKSDEAKQTIAEVHSFDFQKTALTLVYDIYSSNNIRVDTENKVYNFIKNNKKFKFSDITKFILNGMGHVYFKNNKIAKAFLVNNELMTVKNAGSIELLNSLEDLCNNSNKSDFDKYLLYKDNEKINVLDYINYNKGIYYLQKGSPRKALVFFNKNKSYEGKIQIPATIFSNNTVECFNCTEDFVMDDEVYKAKPYAFITKEFSRKQLTENLIKLQDIADGEKNWKAKLANYLLANYYFNICNTGYYRGILTDNTNIGSSVFMKQSDKYNSKYIIESLSSYNLDGLDQCPNFYFGLADIAMEYYQKTIDMSTDKELNSRCLYMMAKCELNNFYNNNSEDRYNYSGEIYMPNKMKSFDKLNSEYSNTNFYKMIINECANFMYYNMQD